MSFNNYPKPDVSNQITSKRYLQSKWKLLRSQPANVPVLRNMARDIDNPANTIQINGVIPQNDFTQNYSFQCENIPNANNQQFSDSFIPIDDFRRGISVYYYPEENNPETIRFYQKYFRPTHFKNSNNNGQIQQILRGVFCFQEGIRAIYETQTYNQFASDFPGILLNPISNLNSHRLTSIFGTILVNTLTSVSSLVAGTTLSNGILTYVEAMMVNTLGLSLPATFIDATRSVGQTTILPMIRDTMNKTTYIDLKVTIPQNSSNLVNGRNIWSNGQVNPMSKIAVTIDNSLASDTFIVTNFRYVTTTFL